MALTCMRCASEKVADGIEVRMSLQRENISKLHTIRLAVDLDPAVSRFFARFDQYHSIFISHDFALLERLATSDLLHVTASGHVNTLQDLEKSLSDPAVKIENIYSDNHQVRFSGDTAVLVARIHATGARD